MCILQYGITLSYIKMSFQKNENLEFEAEIWNVVGPTQQTSSFYSCECSECFCREVCSYLCHCQIYREWERNKSKSYPGCWQYYLIYGVIKNWYPWSGYIMSSGFCSGNECFHYCVGNVKLRKQYQQQRFLFITD